MAGSVFPPCYLPRAKLTVKVMKIMVTSFKRSRACTATLSVPSSAAGHYRPMPLLETPDHLWASLGQYSVGSLLLSPGSWCAQGSVCACQEFVSLEPDILECEVKWALESITMNKASGGDGIPAELFQILKDDAVEVLLSICQQIWKTWQWSQDWKKSVFIPVPKKGNAKECSNYLTIWLISHVSKLMLKILQARL